ncbi:MAG: ABC transporter permease [Bacilli bacterium]|nr:ABC transporter permease [Bacilli bacterium]
MYSKEHLEYLRKIKINKFLVRFTQVFIIVFLIVLWQVAADNGWINTFISSSPKAAIKTVISLYNDGTLLHHMWVTFYEVVISFILGTLIGLIIATLLWRFKFLSNVLDPYLTVLNSLPKVSLGPIIIIVAGAGIKSIIIMALFISVIITIMDIYGAFSSTDYNKIRLMQSFNASQSQIFFKLILPSNFKNIISVLKVNLSLTFIGVIMGEFLVSKAGIGYLIMYGSQVFNLNLVVAGIIILAFMASVLYYLILFIEKRLSKNR